MITLLWQIVVISQGKGTLESIGHLYGSGFRYLGSLKVGYMCGGYVFPQTPEWV